MLVSGEGMLCLVTRIKVKGIFTLIGIAFAFFRMQRRSRTVSGLLETAMLVRWPRTVIFVSLWKDASAMACFATAVPEHPMMVRKVYRMGAEVWSGVFKLDGQNREETWDSPLKKVVQSI
jgi:ABC-type antimicrobial peptide transport system permease subunit